MIVKRTAIVIAMSLLPLTGCSMPPIGGASDATQANLLHDKRGSAHPRANESPMEKGRRYFKEGSFALAEEVFRAEVEQDAKNADAWLGLAASYDRLRRFDLAMRAYSSVTRLRGYTPTVLNNLGYHYYLQGNTASALKTMERAHAADSSNPYIISNLKKIRAAASRKQRKRRAKG